MSDVQITDCPIPKPLCRRNDAAFAGRFAVAIALGFGMSLCASASHAEPSAASLSRSRVAVPRVLASEHPAIRSQKSATAFFVDGVGHMLTARHAVEDCARIVVAKEGRAAVGRVLALSSRVDLALIKVPRTWGLAAVFPRSNTAATNEWVFAAAYDTLPGMVGRSGMLANATVASSFGGAEAGHLVLNSRIGFGGSGAPVLDGRGLVEGVVSRRTMFDRVLAVGASESKAFLASHAIRVEQDDRPQIAGSGSRANRAASLSARVLCYQT